MRTDEAVVSLRRRDLGSLARALGPRAQRDHPLGALTTYRVGGRAALFEEVVDEARLMEVARCTSQCDLPVLVLGRGSNLLVADRGFDGLVLALGPGFDTLDLDGTRVRAGAALSLPVLARRTAAAGLRGLEWAVGVPGSVGGAIRMNAGGHGSDTAATLVAYRSVDLADGTVTDSPADRLEPAYRHTTVRPDQVVASGTFQLEAGDPAEGAATIAEIVRWRRANQPGGANAGSVFTNPAGDSAGRLIDACGLKGFRIGSASVSTKHANFIQADPGGSADDVVAVMGHVREVVAGITGTVPADRGPAGRLQWVGGGRRVNPPEPPEGPEPPGRPDPSGPPGIDPRIRQRRVAIRRSQGRKRLLWMGGATGVLVLVVLVVALAHTPWFGARAISVTGSHPHTPEAAIVDAAGLQHQPPLISVNPGLVARRVEALPFIATAQVRKHWPDGVQIKVTERVPVVEMSGPGPSWSLLDGHGRTLQVVPTRPPGVAAYVVHTATSVIPPAPVGGSLPPAAGPGLEVAADPAPGLRRSGVVGHGGGRRLHQHGPRLGDHRALRDRCRPDRQVRGPRGRPGQRDPARHLDHRRVGAGVADGERLTATGADGWVRNPAPGLPTRLERA